MTLIDKIRQDRIEAIKTKDGIRKSTLTTLIGDIETINKGPNGPIDDLGVVALVKKHIVGLQEMVNYGSGDVGKFQQEIVILSEYLPSQLGHEDIEAILTKAVKTGQVKNIGDAMKMMKAHYAGQYDGKVASRIAKNLLG